MSIHEAIIIYPTGVVEPIVLPDGESDRLRTLQGLVGGCIEGVPLPDGRYMLVNENGKDGFHVINQVATDLTHQAEAIMADDYIAGTAVILPAEALE